MKACRVSILSALVILIGVAGSAALAAAAPEPGALTLDPPYRAPYLPNGNGQILQQVPAASDPNVRNMQALRDQLNADPGNLRLAAALARAYIEFGREVGDAHYAGYAEAVLAPWLAKAPPPLAALNLQATILQFRHQFADARDLFKTVAQRDPRNTQAWLSLATLDMVQGNYAAAADECSRAGRSGGLTIGLACSGNLRSYLGQAQQSVTLLARVETGAPALSASFNAWIQGLLAESEERLGNWAQAESHYRKALAYAPDDNFLLVAYADFLLDRNRPKEVSSLLAPYAQSDTAFLRLSLAEAALGSPDVARYAWIIAARFEALTQRGSDFYGREQVRFALYLQHDPAAALSLAQQNWKVQRAPWDARVLLEAALAAEQPEAAATVLAFLQQTKLQDPIIEQLAQKLRARLDGAPPLTR